MNKVNLVQPYNPLWKVAFNCLKKELEAALKDFEPDIQHVGSTAVPGLCAKPVLDVDIILQKKAHLTGVAVVLNNMGYINKGEQGTAGRFAFRQIHSKAVTAYPGAWQKHHLYVCFKDSLALKNHLVFRDALLQHPHLVSQYARLKLDLTSIHEITRDQYNSGKTGFILWVLSQHGLNNHEISEIARANALT